ncbi:helix-turn-helix domain-containing protein [Enterococcus hirae]|uniref:helix-turn-helix domain-containing protein n=1 Tax=Enterococcus hirae TaxID=1354 RepID=UPI001177677F|nr:helix-turn-helix domain-containing protein [Enterococcus hirae]
MSQSRKTTFKERVEIVHYCIVHDHNYGKTAIKYQVSYQQVRNWVLKYKRRNFRKLTRNTKTRF